VCCCSWCAYAQQGWPLLLVLLLIEVPLLMWLLHHPAA
jgi:hypothetical protein